MIDYTTANFGGFQANFTDAFGEAAGSNRTGQSLGLGGDGRFSNDSYQQ